MPRGYRYFLSRQISLCFEESLINRRAIICCLCKTRVPAAGRKDPTRWGFAVFIRKKGKGQLINKQKIKDTFYLLRDIYTVLYISFFAVLFFIPILNALGRITTFLYLAIAGLGAALLFLSVFVQRAAFLSMPNFVLSLFAGAALLSTAVNFRYEPVSNIKEICWMCIMFFIIQYVDTTRPKERLMYVLRLVTNVFIMIWFVGALWSFCQFVVGYGAWIYTPYNDTEIHRVGFVEERLFGVFGDPNYAAIGSLFAIVFAVFNMTGEKVGKALKALYIVTIVFEYIYLVLSGSRAALISMAVAVFFIVFFLTLKNRHVRGRKTVVRVIVSMVMATVFAAAVVLISKLLTDLLAYLPSLYGNICKLFGVNTGQNAPVNLHRTDISEGKDASNNRFKIWMDSLKVWKTSPLVGVTPRGYLAYTLENLGNLYIVQKGYIIHNAYISVLLFTGIIGTVLAAAWIVYTAWIIVSYLFKYNLSNKEEYNTVLLFSALIVAEAVSSAALSQMFFSHMVTDALFWLTVGYTFYFIRCSKLQDQPAVMAEKAPANAIEGN